MISADRFISQTGMTFASGRGAELTAVDNALRTYNGSPNADNARRLANAIITWARAKGLKSNGDINTGRNATVVRQLVTDVGNTRGGEACKNLRAAVGTSVKSTGNAQELVNGVIGELDKCKQFACSDVGTFPGDINQNLQKPSRDAIYNKGTSKGKAAAVAIKAGPWDANLLAGAHRAVYNNKAGECTSFAQAAAHLLTTFKPLRTMPQIEIVTFKNPRNVKRWEKNKVTGKYDVPMYKKDPKDLKKNLLDSKGKPIQVEWNQPITHVFCVVGRGGQAVAPGNPMPDSGTWGDNCRIVDCWLGALGHECAYSVADYPRKGYLAPGKVSKVMGT